MTIKEVESLTGLARSNIRFYEKENLFEPARNEKNGYREYSMQDVEDIKKIAYLRTLGISIEEIRAVKTGKATLQQAVERQSQSLEGQIAELGRAKAMCRQMLRDGDLSYGNLRVEDYTEKLRDYWESSRPVFQLDSVSFLYLWGSMAAWAAITGLCLLFGILSYGSLPPKIPV
ncbi:MAG: MerR family transcriptional regulator, partial [Lachnospiraceae bacterium]|nr:MerR family transcriptional regulator [Lachnospiraceae bacterium]